MRLLVIALVCVACGGRPPASQNALSATWSAPSMLAKVPADAPYLFAVLDPVPEVVRQQFYASLDAKLNQARLDAKTIADRSALPVKERALYAIVDELDGKSLAHWGQELGFDASGRFVFYGLSVWPVVRVAVANERRLREVINHVIAKAGIPAAQHALQGHSYWQLSANNISVVASVDDGELVFAAMPTPALPEYLPIVLGLQRPQHSQNDDNKVGAVTARYHFMSTTVGYLDLKIIADILGQHAATTNTELDKPLRTAMGPIDDACRADLDRLAALTPRIVMGYRRLDRKGMQGTFVFEMPPAITGALQRLHTSVPDMSSGMSERALIQFGIAAKLDELRPLLRKITDHIHDQPFQCAWFASLNTASAKLGALLDQPLPPALLGLRGLSVVIQDMTMKPWVPRGHATLVADHASDLLAIMMPLTGLTVTIRPDGVPVQLPLAGLGAPSAVLGYAATRVDRAVIALGPDSARDVVRVLDQPQPQHSPLLSMTFDMQRMFELGLVTKDDASDIRDVALQVEVAPEGLVVEMFGTFPAK